MSAKHTPGPWRVVAFDLDEGGDGIAIIGANGEKIADNQTCYPHALDAKNAHLIAAAPELLEVVRALLTHLKSWKTIEVEGGWIGTARELLARIEEEH